MVPRAPASGQSRGQADERLLVEAAQKDPHQFGALYELHFELVYAYVVRRVGDRDAAEDLTADVFHKALAGLPRFEWRGAPFATWLLRIAANAIADRGKRPAREVTDLDSIPEAGAVPDLAKIERHALLFRLVDKLPEDQRRVVIMRFAEQKSIKEIAHEMHRSEGAVKQLQLRALGNLRKQVEGAHA